MTKPQKHDKNGAGTTKGGGENEEFVTNDFVIACWVGAFQRFCHSAECGLGISNDSKLNFRWLAGFGDFAQGANQCGDFGDIGAHRATVVHTNNFPFIDSIATVSDAVAEAWNVARCSSIKTNRDLHS